MSAAVGIASSRALRWGGGGLAVAGALELLLSAGPGIAVTETITVPYSSLGLPLVAELLLLLACLVLAVGLPSSSGGFPRIGGVGLVVFGSGGVAGEVLSVVAPLGGPLLLVLGTAVQVLPVVGIVVAAALAARATGLGTTRWALGPVAVVDLLVLVLQYIPAVEVVPALMLLTGVVLPMTVVIAGAACMLATTSTATTAPLGVEPSGSNARR